MALGVVPWLVSLLPALHFSFLYSASNVLSKTQTWSSHSHSLKRQDFNRARILLTTLSQSSKDEVCAPLSGPRNLHHPASTCLSTFHFLHSTVPLNYSVMTGFSSLLCCLWPPLPLTLCSIAWNTLSSFWLVYFYKFFTFYLIWPLLWAFNPHPEHVPLLSIQVPRHACVFCPCTLTTSCGNDLCVDLSFPLAGKFTEAKVHTSLLTCKCWTHKRYRRISLWRFTRFLDEKNIPVFCILFFF